MNIVHANPEAFVLGWNVLVLWLTYSVVMPRFVQGDVRRLLVTDAVMSVLSLGVVAAVFAGSGVTFRLVAFDANWFIFAFATYLILEIPLSMRLMASLRSRR